MRADYKPTMQGLLKPAVAQTRPGFGGQGGCRAARPIKKPAVRTAGLCKAFAAGT